jgi:hypothetical protein
MGNVVHFPASNNLRLKEIVGSRGGVITEWLSRNQGARARLRIRVLNLRRMPRTEWKKTEFRYVGNGLAEIKWKAGIQFRIIGFDHGGYFVCVLGCTHKQNIYDPPEWLDTAKRRKREVENGQWSTILFEP